MHQLIPTANELTPPLTATSAPTPPQSGHSRIADIPENFADTFSAGDKALLISGNEGLGDSRAAPHRTMLDAAGPAGVALLAYTSTPGTMTATPPPAHTTTPAGDGDTCRVQAWLSSPR